MELKPSTITPSVGRKMWFFASEVHEVSKGMAPPPGVINMAAPFDATVIYVHGPDMVNLRVTDHVGTVYTRASVPVADYDESYRHGVRNVAAWMPYQSGQAAKQAAGSRPPDAVLRKIADNDVPITE